MKKLTKSKLRQIIFEELSESFVGARHMGVDTGRHNLEPRNAYHQIKNELEDRGSRASISGMDGYEYAGYFWHVAQGGVRVYEPSRLEREGEVADTSLHLTVNDRLNVQVHKDRRQVDQFEFRTGRSAVDAALEYL